MWGDDDDEEQRQRQDEWNAIQQEIQAFFAERPALLPETQQELAAFERWLHSNRGKLTRNNVRLRLTEAFREREDQRRAEEDDRRAQREHALDVQYRELCRQASREAEAAGADGDLGAIVKRLVDDTCEEGILERYRNHLAAAMAQVAAQERAAEEAAAEAALTPEERADREVLAEIEAIKAKMAADNTEAAAQRARAASRKQRS
jgi:hypothetical protein